MKKNPKNEATPVVAAPIPGGTSRSVWLWLAVIILWGTFFRLAWLGMSALRSDTILFWAICHEPIGIGRIFSEWMKLVGSGQMPLPMAIAKGFLDVFHLPVTHFTIRLPMALIGIATIPAAFFMGRTIGGNVLGLITAGLLAFNPFHIQFSREIYYYAPLMLGAFLLLWGTLAAASPENRRRALPLPLVLLILAGFWLLAHSQVVGWSLAFVCVLVIVVLEGIKFWRTRKINRGMVVLFLGLLLLGLPLLFADWGLPQHKTFYSNTEAQAQEARVSHTIKGDSVEAMTTFAMIFAWGNTPLRAGWLALSVVGALFMVIRMWRRDGRYALVLAMLVVGFIIFLYGRERNASMYEPRYVAGLLPVYLLLLAAGLTAPLQWPRLAPARAMQLCLALGVFACALNAWPAYLSTRITGKPVPYKDIVKWFDENPPPGTLVLVDRWFEPWNELAVYPSTNAYFTFTIPNEPPDAYLQNHWRESAMNFFAKNPDAIFLDIAQTCSDDPRIGQWTWPATHFGRHVGITNSAGLKLRELGLVNRSDFLFPNTNRVVANIYYNTREDLLQAARTAGQPLQWFYGPGWKFEKTGPVGFLRIQTQDFREWRSLQDAATLELHNLTDAPLRVALRINAVAVGGPKQVWVGTDRTLSFPQNRPMEQDMGTLELQPGLNVVSLRDILWSRQNNLLLVDDIRVTPVASPAP